MAVAAMMALAVFPAVPSYAESPPAGGLRVVSYSVQTVDGNEYTGRIHMGDHINIVLKVYDDRPFLANYSAGDKPAPDARLNTESFTIPSQSNITVLDVALAGSGWTYTLRFGDLVYTGAQNTFRCEIFYKNDIAEAVPYESVLYQCVVYEAPALPEQPETPEVVVKGTGFVLKSAGYGQSAVYAGQPFTLSATVLATNGDHNVENVTIGVTPPKELSLQDGSSLVYVGTVAPGQSVPVSFSLVPAADMEEGSSSILLDIKGIDAKSGTEIMAQATVSVPVLQPERFEIFSTQLPTDLMMGMDDGSGYGSVTLVNQGRGTVSNVSVEIVGEGLSTEEGKQYLGHIAGGEQKTAEFTFTATMPGQIAANVLVTYESRGEQKELTHEFSVSVEDAALPEFDDGMQGLDPGMEEPAPSTGFPVWGWILIAAGVAVAAVLLAVRRIRKKRAGEADAFDDEDDEEANS
jgi:hypothetical protein